MSKPAREVLGNAASLPPHERAEMAAALIASVRDEMIEVALEPEELSLLRRGLNEWGGPAQCTEEMAVAMGFLGTEHFSGEVYDRLLPALIAGQPLSRVDWLRVLLATEIVFASDVLGSGAEWHITTGLSDADTLALLRGVQRKLGRDVRFLVGAGFGTRRRPAPHTPHILEGQLARLAERLEAAGFHVRQAPFFASMGIGVSALPRESKAEITVCEGTVFIYPFDGDWELRVTQHGGPHWTRRVASIERVEEMASALLTDSAWPPGPHWTVADP